MEKVNNVNIMGNVSAEKFDVEALAKLVTNVRNTQKAACGAESERAAQEKERDLLRDQLQEALDKDDTEALSKLNTKLRLVKTKLDESPAVKIGAFDDAINALAKFITEAIPEEDKGTTVVALKDNKAA